MRSTKEATEKARILVVDDDPANHRMMHRILKRQGFDVLRADDGYAALELLQGDKADLILLDLMMPGMSGFQVAERLKSRPDTGRLPIILLTGLNEVDNQVKAFEMGVDDFLPKTADPAEILARVRYQLKVKRSNDRLFQRQRFLEDTVQLKSGQLRHALAQLKGASLEIIWRLMAASEYRDNETGAHIQRMSQYAAAVAREMGLKSKTVETILYAAPMHDVGKIGIPDDILSKPGKLTAAEWTVMRTHTTIGADILKGSNISFIRMAETIALTHHEKWDGSGYPRGLKGTRIPLAGRIAALADVFDALTSDRPYKPPFPVEKANGIIKEGSGAHFDPAVVAAFFSIQEEILDIKDSFQDQPRK